MIIASCFIVITLHSISCYIAYITKYVLLEICVPVIDSDAHVVETERTWEYINNDDIRFKPVLAASREEPKNYRWLVDDKLRRRAMLSDIDHLRPVDRNTHTPENAREMSDIQSRLDHMDQLGIDIQVLHNTLFIEQVVDRIEVDVAVCMAWNRWLADIWSKGNGRFRWSCVLPLTSINDSLDQMRFAKNNGAVAVCMRPIESTRTLPDIYFYPIYEEAQRLNMAIAVHIANGNSAVCDVLRSPYDPGSSFAMFRAMTAVSCHSYMVSELPQKFNQLRWGFIEASAQWAPWVAHEARRRYEASGKAFPDNPFAEFQIYITCQNDDDLDYIVHYVGEDNLLIGTDYGHFDPSSEVDAISILKNRTDLDTKLITKIVDFNPRNFYAI